MANININNLFGSDSLNNSESYLVDINDDATNILGGGLKETITSIGQGILAVLQILLSSDVEVVQGGATITITPPEK